MVSLNLGLDVNNGGVRKNESSKEIWCKGYSLLLNSEGHITRNMGGLWDLITAPD